MYEQNVCRCAAGSEERDEEGGDWYICMRSPDTVLLAGFIGGMVAVLNFFLMGLTVQKIVSMEDDKQAAAKMKASYSQRMMLQLIWGVLAIAVPCFQFVAGILPLLFPNIVIKTVGIIGGRKAA